MKKALIAILAACLLLHPVSSVLADGETTALAETEIGETLETQSSEEADETLESEEPSETEQESGESETERPEETSEESEEAETSTEDTEPTTEEETTEAETTEEPTEESTEEPAEETTEAVPETEPETTYPAFEKREEFVEYLISLIDDAFPDETIVRQARAEFDQLTNAQQVRLPNAEKLFAAERLLNAAVGTEAVDQEKTKSGTKYSFRLNKYLPQVSLYIWYTTDISGDGKPDAPALTLVTPGGVAVSVLDSMMEVNDDNCEVQLIRSSQYIRLDFLRAMEGTWSVMASHRVSFELRDYSADATPFEEATSGEAQPSTENQTQERTTPKTNFVPLILFAVCVPLLFFMIKKMGKKAPKKEDVETEKEKARRQKREHEEEMEKIRKDWYEMHEHEYEDEPKKKKAEEKKETDIRLEETQEELDDDSDIEDIDEEDLSFFSKPRF